MRALYVIKEAKEQGLTRYFTGEPCKYGHIDERHIGNRTCVACQRISDATRKDERYKIDKLFRKKVIARGVKRQGVRYKEDPSFREQRSAYQKKYYDLYPEKFHERTKQWNANNVERRKEISRRWAEKSYQNNPEKHRKFSRTWRINNIEKAKERVRQWQIKNPNKINFHNSKRRASKLLAIPKWADMEKIKEIYSKAVKNRMVVDHIIPLQSQYVCGLHVENNLQLLTAEENSRKHNKFEMEVCY